MKWVQHSLSTYKCVNDDDPRPAVDLPSKEGVPYFAYTPSWAAYEPLMHSGDPKTESAALDAFVSERATETAHSKRAREWELGRKKSWEREKPNWVKKGRTISNDKS